MRPTHLVTFTPDGYEYEFYVSSNIYWCRSVGKSDWDGPYRGFDAYLNTKDWDVKRFNTFKGNK